MHPLYVVQYPRGAGCRRKGSGNGDTALYGIPNCHGSEHPFRFFLQSNQQCGRFRMLPFYYTANRGGMQARNGKNTVVGSFLTNAASVWYNAPSCAASGACAGVCVEKRAVRRTETEKGIHDAGIIGYKSAKDRVPRAGDRMPRSGDGCRASYGRARHADRAGGAGLHRA